MFSLIELNEVMRQKDDLEFIQLLNNIRVGNVDEDVENKLKSRFTEKNNKELPHDKLHIFAENEFVNRHNKQFLECLSGGTFKIDAIDIVPVNCNSNKYLINAAQNQKLTNTGGLAKTLELKIGSRVMLTVNFDIEHYLINSQVGQTTFFEPAGSRISKIFVKFDNTNVDRKRKMLGDLAQQYDSVPIERYETEIKINMKSASFPHIRRTQFPSTLAWACTVHQTQGLTIDVGVVGFELNKQKAFDQGQMSALSRVTSLSGLLLTNHFNKSLEVMQKQNMNIAHCPEIVLCSSLKTVKYQTIH